MSDLYSMDELLQRFAISALSKERKDEAMNEEIMVGKYTGEFFIKSKDGLVISTDIVNRLANAIENATDAAETNCMSGDLIKLDFDNIQMPTHIDYNINIIENEPVIFDGKCKKIMFYFDYDEFDVVGDTPKIVGTENIVQLIFDVTNEDGSVEEVIMEKSIQSINDYVIDLKEFKNMQNLTLKGVIIIKDENIFNEDADYRTMIIHNIFVVLNK